MKSHGLKIALACLLAAVSCSGLWGADLNIKGNVNVQGGGSSNSPGNLSVRGALSLPGSLFAAKFYKRYIATAMGNNVTQQLGDWDFCFLTMVRFNDHGDRCLVEPLADGVALQENWELTAQQNASCYATCVSFSPTQTGN